MSYEAVDPEFKNENLYAEWMSKGQKASGNLNVEEAINSYFNKKYFGAKETIMVGLFFQIVQLAAFGIATSNWYNKQNLIFVF